MRRAAVERPKALLAAHPAGGAALARVALRLRRCQRRVEDRNVVAAGARRLGGDGGGHRHLDHVLSMHGRAAADEADIGSTALGRLLRRFLAAARLAQPEVLLIAEAVLEPAAVETARQVRRERQLAHVDTARDQEVLDDVLGSVVHD